MDHFLYKNGVLHAEDVSLSEIAATVGTPFYAYSTATLLRHFALFDEALAGMDHLVCYAMKAASNHNYFINGGEERVAAKSHLISSANRLRSRGLIDS